MLKKILILGSQRNKSQEIIDFFKKHTNKYKITALLCNDETKLDFFKKQIKEIQPVVIFFPNEKVSENLEQEFNIKCFFDYSLFTSFLKNSDCDIVVSDFTGIDSVKLILASIGENKDVSLLNLEPILYSGKIIVNEAKLKAIDLKYITSQFLTLSEFLKIKNISDINKIILVDYNTKYDKKDILDYTFPSKQLSEFKKIYYFKNKMWLSRHLFSFCSSYNLTIDNFECYKSSTNNLNLILHLKDGNYLFNYNTQDKETIFVNYYMPSVFKNENLQTNIEINLNKIKIDDIDTLKLAKRALNQGGTYSVLFQIVYDICLEELYYNNISKDIFVSFFTKILDDKSFFSKNPNIQTIFALEKKIKEKIKKEYLKKEKVSNKRSNYEKNNVSIKNKQITLQKKSTNLLKKTSLKNKIKK